MHVFVCVAGERAVLQIEVFGLACDAVCCLLTFLSFGLLLLDLACTCCLPARSCAPCLGSSATGFLSHDQNLFDLLGLTVFGLHRFRAEVLGFLEKSYL